MEVDYQEGVPSTNTTPSKFRQLTYRMANLKIKTPVQGTEVSFTIAKAIEKAKTLLITNEEGQAFLISNDLLLQKGIVNPTKLVGQVLQLEPLETKVYNGITFAKVIEDDINVNAFYEASQLDKMAAYVVNRKFDRPAFGSIVPKEKED